jgi:hypothetical protein
MKKSIILIVAFLALSFKTTERKQEAENISIITVIANPEKYHKKTIQIQGYFTNEKEGTAIYLAKNDFQNLIYKNGIYLYIPDNAMEKFKIELPHQGYVTITGVYNKDKKGSYNFYSGGLENITQIDRMYKRGSLRDEYNMD